MHKNWGGKKVQSQIGFPCFTADLQGKLVGYIFSSGHIDKQMTYPNHDTEAWVEFQANRFHPCITQVDTEGFELTDVRQGKPVCSNS